MKLDLIVLAGCLTSALYLAVSLNLLSNY